MKRRDGMSRIADKISHQKDVPAIQHPIHKVKKQGWFKRKASHLWELIKKPKNVVAGITLGLANAGAVHYNSPGLAALTTGLALAQGYTNMKEMQALERKYQQDIGEI